MGIVGTEVRITGTSWTGVIKSVHEDEDGPWSYVQLYFEAYDGMDVPYDLDGLETLDGENVFQIWAS